MHESTSKENQSISQISTNRIKLGLIRFDSRAKLLWDFLVSCAVVSTIFIIPLMLALNLRYTGIWLIFDFLINVIFIIDIILNFFTTYRDGLGIITDKKLIARRYLKSWFFLDVLAAIPFFMLTGSAFANINRMLRFLRLMRVIKIFSLFRMLNRIRKAKISSNLIRMLTMAFWLIITAHLIACGFIIVGGLPADLSNGMQYLSALYWTITTLATVGYGDITPDKKNATQLIYTIFAQISGVGMYGYVIGSISSVINNIDISKTNFMEKLEKINTFLRFRNLSERLIKKVNNYYDYLWESKRGYEENRILAELPDSLRLQIAREIHANIISQVPLFRTASPQLIRDIILHLNPRVFTPGDIIIQKGDLGNEMFFINTGSVEVLSADDKNTVVTLLSGSFFGELALLYLSPRNASIRAREYCDLYALHKHDFDKVLQLHPDFAAEVERMALSRKKD